MNSRLLQKTSRSVSGSLSLVMEPALPHITEGYVSLRHVVNALVTKIYAELTGILQKLPSIPNDAARKRAFLEFVVAARQEVVKLYVLCKWAVVAPDISKSIDITSWLRGQHNCFINVIAALFHLQQDMGAAKLHHADIETALHVLKYGKTQNSTYGFVAPAPLESQEILAVLKNLNVLLSIRLALSEKLPSHYRNYSIQNGRVRFKVPGSFWVDLGVADDAVDARFFYIDFGFDFKSKCSIHAALRSRLEAAANEKLASQSLKESLDWLLVFTSNYKLTLVSRQLVKLEHGLWYDVLEHKFNASSGKLQIRYWTTKKGSYKLELSVTNAASVAFAPLAARWSIDEKEQTLPPAVMGEFGGTDLDVGALLNRLTTYHVKQLVDELARPGIVPASDSAVIMSIENAKALKIAIDHSSGIFSVQSEGQVVGAGEALNELKDLSEVGPVIDKIRVLTKMDQITRRAEAAGWIARPGIRLPPADMAKFNPKTLAVLALRMPAWPQGWYVAVGLTSCGETVWAAAQMKTQQRRWQLDTLHLISVSDDMDYALFDRLAAFCTSQFALFDLCRQLDDVGVRHVPGSQKLQLVLDRRTLVPSANWAHSALILDWTPGKITVRGCARAKRFAELGESGMSNGLSITATGEFTIELDAKNDLLTRLRAQLARLERIAAALRLARFLKLEVIEASPSLLSLGYAGGKARLTVSGENLESIELAKDNPQKILSPFLPPLLAQGGLGTVVKFLSQTFPLFELLATARVTVLPRGATHLLVRRSLGMSDPELEVQVRYWRASPVVYVTANAAAAASPVVNEFFTRPVSPATTPLRQAVVINMSGVQAVERLLKAL